MSEPNHDDILEFVRRNRKPFVKTKEVAEEFDGVSRRTINSRLNDLVEAGKLEKTEIPPKSNVYWIPAETTVDSEPPSPHH